MLCSIANLWQRTCRLVVGTVRIYLIDRFKLTVGDASRTFCNSHKYTNDGIIFKFKSDALNVFTQMPVAQLIHLSIKCAREKFTPIAPYNIHRASLRIEKGWG